MAEPTNKLIQIVSREQYLVERECFDEALDVAYRLMPPNWSRVADLGRRWDEAIRPYMGSSVVEGYHSGELSFEDIKRGLRSLIYDMASWFAFEERKMFVKQERSLGLITDPFRFDDAELNRQAEKTILQALKTYDPSKGAKFSTWFVTLFETDLLDLYGTYKGKPIEVKDRDHFDELGLTWTDTFVSLHDLTNIPTDDLTDKEKRWMSLVLETPPWYILNNICRSQKMGYKSDEPDLEIRKGLRKKLSGHYKESSRRFELTSNVYGDPNIPDPTADVVFRIVAGEIPTYKPDKLVKAKPSNIKGTTGIIIEPREYSQSWPYGYCGVCGLGLTTDGKCSNTNICKGYLTKYVKKRLKIE